jgi:cobalt-zinc-cadmium efflux system outer membrane protein
MPDVFRRVSTVVLRLFALLFLAGTCAVASAHAEESMVSKPASDAEKGALTLRQALAEALLHNPELDVYSQEIRAREAEGLQAGLRPNPVLSLETENVFGSGPFSGTDAAEGTFALHQTFELGNKRDLRRHLAEAETSIAQGNFELAKSNLLARATDGFFAVLAAQERLRLAEELTDLTKRVLDTVEERVAAGRAAETEAIRFRIQLRDGEIARDKARRHLAAVRSGLATLMGRDRAEFDQAVGEISSLFPLPDPSQLEKLATGSPRIALQVTESELSRRAVSLEQARRIPDLDVGVGARHFRESDDTALVFDLSLPLPIFDRNQGAIAAARSRQAKARAEERRALLQVREALSVTWQEMSAAREEAEALRDDIIPASRRALEAAEYGYRAGKFGVLDVLDARRTWVEARERHLESLIAFHRAATELERLLGSSFDPGRSSLTLSATAKE